MYSVYLAKDKETGDKWALKIIKSEVLETLDFEEIEKEVEILRNLNHFNLTKLIDSGTAELRTRNSSKDVFYIAIELARGGELFDFIALTGQFKEEEARFFFHQLIDGLDYMHTKGYSHRDLKAENILLDKKFNIKIADFGYASRKSKNSTQVGTFDYMAPEIIRADRYSGPFADLFGAGLILFLMVTKNKPFLKASPSDDYYKQLLSNRSDRFWAIHLRPFGDDFLSEEIKDLLLGLFESNPARRLSISEIKAHPWYKGKVRSHDKIKKEFKKRKALIKEHLKNAEEEKVEYDSDIFTTNVARGIGIEEDDEGFEEVFREVQEYDPDFNRITEFFSSRWLDDIWYTTANFFKSLTNDVVFSPTEYTALAKMVEPGTNSSETLSKLEICVNILKVPEKEKHCIEVVLLKGDRLKFNDVFKTMKEYYAGIVNASDEEEELSDE